MRNTAEQGRFNRISSHHAIFIAESEWSSIASNDNWINDNEDILLFPLLQYLTSGKKRSPVEEYLLIVEVWWSDLEFKEHIRLSRRTIYNLISNYCFPFNFKKIISLYDNLLEHGK